MTSILFEGEGFSFHSAMFCGGFLSMCITRRKRRVFKNKQCQEIKVVKFQFVIFHT